MYSKYSLRFVFYSLCGVCAGLIGIALILQLVREIEPSPLCILQRYALAGCGLLALLGALHNSQGLMRRLYAFAILALSLAGGGVAARQIWLQHNQPLPSACGHELQSVIGHFPLSHALPVLFQGAGDCVKVAGPLLGFSTAEWALLFFCLIALTSLWQALRRTPERRRFS